MVHSFTEKETHQLEIIRKVVNSFKDGVKERYDEERNESIFDLGCDGPLSSSWLIYSPGTLTVYGVFGVKAKPKHMPELERFATIFNRIANHGCLMVRENGELIYRTDLTHRRVAVLDGGFVAGALFDLVDNIELIDLPLILIAKGKTAEASVEEVWESTKERSIW